MPRGALRTLPALHLSSVLLVRQLGSQAIPVTVDVTKQEQCKALIDTAVREFGEIDVLVLCAGIGAHHVFADTQDLAMFKKLIDVNFYGQHVQADTR